jgi:hypothetical protein
MEFGEEFKTEKDNRAVRARLDTGRGTGSPSPDADSAATWTIAAIRVTPPHSFGTRSATLHRLPLSLPDVVAGAATSAPISWDVGIVFSEQVSANAADALCEHLRLLSA